MRYAQMSEHHMYLRFAEVERHCRPVLSSATLLATGFRTPKATHP
jgi:hypothetical protein